MTRYTRRHIMRLWRQTYHESFIKINLSKLFYNMYYFGPPKSDKRWNQTAETLVTANLIISNQHDHISLYLHTYLKYPTHMWFVYFILIFISRYLFLFWHMFMLSLYVYVYIYLSTYICIKLCKNVDVWHEYNNNDNISLT